MANDTTVYIPLLKMQYLFQSLDDNQMKAVEEKFEVKSVSPGEVVVSQREIGKYFYIVVKGKVGVIQTVGSKEQQLNILKPGDYFGEDALLFRHPSKATYVSYSRTTLLHANYEQFD